jgi:hypothetical protein
VVPSVEDRQVAAFEEHCARRSIKESLVFLQAIHGKAVGEAGVFIDRESTHLLRAASCDFVHYKPQSVVFRVHDHEVPVGADDEPARMVEGSLRARAVSSSLNNMFIKNLETTWVPKTLEKLDMERKKLGCEYVMLGMPSAHKQDELPPVKDAIVKVVEETLDRDVPRLLKDYCTLTLNHMKQKIKDVVRKAVTDAFCSPELEADHVKDEEEEQEREEEDAEEDEDDLIIDVQLENFDQVCERVPDVLTPLMKLMNSPQFASMLQMCEACSLKTNLTCLESRR